MKLKIIFFSLLFSVSLLLPFAYPKNSYAAISASYQPAVELINENTTSVRITYTGLQNGENYIICLDSLCFDQVQRTASSGQIVIDVCGNGGDKLKICDGSLNDDWFHGGSTYQAKILGADPQNTAASYIAQFRVAHFYPEANLSQVDVNHFRLTLTGCRHPCSNDNRNDYDLDIEGEQLLDPPDLHVSPGGSGSVDFAVAQPGDYVLYVKDVEEGNNFVYYKITFTVNLDGNLLNVDINKDPTHNDTGLGAGKNPCGPNGCETAFGNLSVDLGQFAQNALKIATGIAGGLAFILMVIGAIRVLTSSGDQQRLNGGREMIVAAIVGLLFIIFSVLILEFLGINIIGLT